MTNKLKISRRLEAMTPVGVEWAQSISSSAKPPHIRAECADPCIKIPGEALRYASDALLSEETFNYIDFRGLEKLRVAVADHLSQVHGLRYNPETEILITSGCTEANLMGVLSTSDPGDNILILNPSYANFRTYADIAGLVPVYVNTLPEEQWNIDEKDLIAKADRSSPRSIILSVPNNPTGTVLSDSSIHATIDLVQSRNMWLIYDTVFDLTVHNLAALPKFAEIQPNIVLSGATSKVFGIPGCRVGWMAGPTALIQRVLQTIKMGTSISANNFGQYISYYMLTHYKTWIQDWIAEWRTKRDCLIELLRNLPVVYSEPEGGYFMFLGEPGKIRDSYQFAESLIRDFGLYTAPGRDYGSLGEGYVRIVYSTVDHAALQRIPEIWEKYSP
jgi:aminotransferase